MPRQPRYFIPDIPQHVIQRGVDRQAVFFESGDYELYLRSLGEAAKRYECQIHAYVLMTNHTHLLVTPGCERSVPLESTILALVGGVLGGAIAYLAFNGFQVSTLNSASFSQVVFDFAVTSDLLIDGLKAALIIGALGGLLPAIRAARLPVAQALREL